MALKDEIAFGTVLPHRSMAPLKMTEIRSVAQRAEALGFRDLWVTENTLDHAYSLDPMVALTYAAAVTSTIRLGVAVVVLAVHHPIHVAHQAASLDYASNGRAILGVGLGREQDYRDFQIPIERRVRRFKEAVDLIKALWTQECVTRHGDFFQVNEAAIALKPVQKPHLPLWLGGTHPDAISRTATVGDGWIGSGAQTGESFSRSVPLLRAALEKAGRDPASFPISKRVFVAVDEKTEAARTELERWFVDVYRRPELVETAGIYGTPMRVLEKLEELKAMGANHLLLNTVSRYSQQVEALADVVGLR